jgi:hypothetical protein
MQSNKILTLLNRIIISIFLLAPICALSQLHINVAISLYRKNYVRQNKTIPLTDKINFIDDSQTNEKEGDIVLLYQFIYELKIDIECSSKCAICPIITLYS